MISAVASGMEERKGLTSPFSQPDPTRRLPAFSNLRPDREPGTGYTTCKSMKSDLRLNWHFKSLSRYSGLSRCVPSLSHGLPRSSRPELGLFVFVSSTPQIVSS